MWKKASCSAILTASSTLSKSNRGCKKIRSIKPAVFKFF